MDELLASTAFVSLAVTVGGAVGHLLYGEFRGRKAIVVCSACLFGAVFLASALL